MDLEKTIKNLEARHFSVKHFSTGDEAVQYLSEQVQGTTVGFGGCKTADQLGLYDVLGKNNEVFWHWKSTEPDIRDKANAAKVYISSANAISEDGEILNIDGNGNRLAAIVYGNKRVYIVAGTNKICPDFDSALYRARNIAAVENIKRFDKKTPCKLDGKCHDCRSVDRVCNALLVLWGPMGGMQTEIILIDEELGL